MHIEVENQWKSGKAWPIQLFCIHLYRIKRGVDKIVTTYKKNPKTKLVTYITKRNGGIGISILGFEITFWIRYSIKHKFHYKEDEK